MIRLLPILAVLLLTGCGDRTQINPGADLAVYQADAQWMFRTLPPGCNKATTVRLGYYSPSDGSITLSEQLRGYGIARVFAHELGHAYDHQRPRDLWELLDRYQADRFDFNQHKEPTK